MFVPQALRTSFICLFLLIVSFTLSRADAPIDLAKARQYFAEAAEVIERDNGQLWGVRIGAPILLVDPASRTAVGSRADTAGILADSAGLFVGQLPAEVNISNTATSWGGVDWVMLLWPLPEDSLKRNILLAHEGWHAVQQKIGLPGGMPENKQLGEKNGRIWLRLEWRALEKALNATDQEAVKTALTDALLFRAKRYTLYPEAAAEEQTMELHEGMAEYSGTALACPDDAAMASHAVSRLHGQVKRKSLTRSFPYASGPAYGTLLDRTGRDWRSSLPAERPFLHDLIAELYDLNVPSLSDAGLIERAERYGYTEVVADETRREEEHLHKLAQMRERFVDGPVLVLPLANINITYDPGQVVPLGEEGTVYGNLRLTDHWGILETTGGGMIGSTWQQAFVPAPSNPDARPLEGNGWRLDLADGWTVTPGERTGDFQLTRKE